MKSALLIVAGLFAALTPGMARAGVYGDALGRCAVEASTQADRIALMRWVFMTVSENPGVSDLTSITPAAREANLRTVGEMFNRIMLRDCRREAVAALSHEGRAGLEGGFGALGQLAGIEMMATPAAMSAMRGLDRYLDRAGVEALAREAAARPAI